MYNQHSIYGNVFLAIKMFFIAKYDNILYEYEGCRCMVVGWEQRIGERVNNNLYSDPYVNI